MPDTVLDETRYAEMAAEHIGVEIQKVMVNAAISPSDLFGYMYICEDPYITSPIPFMQTYGSIVKEGIKVTIDGHGADELFGGYGSDLFYAALEAQGVAAEESIYVDDYPPEAEGARQLGFASFLLDREGVQPESEWTIYNLRQLVAFVERGWA